MTLPPLLMFNGLGRLPDVARAALTEKHYLHRAPRCRFNYVVWSDEKLAAVVTFGVPASRHLQLGALPSSPDQVIELSRLWVDDAMPKGTASRVISLALANLPPLLVVSYADTAAGHHGGVYRACNFFYAGWTDMDRKTPRFDYVPDNGKHSRDAFRGEKGAFTRVRRKPKVRYWTATGNRSEKKALIKASGWPRLDWKTLPPPPTLIKDVHTEHCCAVHGCKYGHANCTVVTGRAPQSYPCEYCGVQFP